MRMRGSLKTQVVIVAALMIGTSTTWAGASAGKKEILEPKPESWRAAYDLETIDYDEIIMPRAQQQPAPQTQSQTQQQPQTRPQPRQQAQPPSQPQIPPAFPSPLTALKEKEALRTTEASCPTTKNDSPVAVLMKPLIAIGDAVIDLNDKMNKNAESFVGDAPVTETSVRNMRSWRQLTLAELSRSYSRNSIVSQTMEIMERDTNIYRDKNRRVIGHKSPTAPTYRCYMALQIAMHKGGMLSTDRLSAISGPSAKNAGGALKQEGYVNLLEDPHFKSQIVGPSGELKLPYGAVLVYGGSQDGHIEMRTQHGYSSDYVSENNRTHGNVSIRNGYRKLIGVYINPSYIDLRGSGS